MCTAQHKHTLKTLYKERALITFHSHSHFTKAASPPPNYGVLCEVICIGFSPVVGFSVHWYEIYSSP